MPCRAMAVFVFIALTMSASLDAKPQAAPKAAPDPLGGPPFVSAKAWVVLDAKTGTMVGGSNEAEARPLASTSKIMTAWIVLRLATLDAKVLDEIVTYSERAAKTTGSSAKLVVGEKLPVKELLYGLLLPSGNDAAVALAEHFGPRLGDAAEGDGLQRFVAEMNRRAAALGLKTMAYKDPHGLSRENVSSARDLGQLAREAKTDERFQAYVSTRKHECEVIEPNGGKRTVTWVNTNKLLDIEGYEGIKTGTTTPAGNCLVGCAQRGDDHLIVVVLGSTSTEGRYVDARNLFRWAWLERGLKPVAKVEQPTAAEVFERRIMPIFKSPNPSSCVQCHLAVVDLKDYILPDAEKTFRSLRDQGLIDLDAPEKSKIVKLIDMGTDEANGPTALHAKARMAEREAFVAWIAACSADPKLRAAPKLAEKDLALPSRPVEVIRHARKDAVLESFEKNVWAWRFRCMNCHTEGRRRTTSTAWNSATASHGSGKAVRKRPSITSSPRR